jgi:oligopeptide/dipeptide ABC transporter ATP-binding protein
MQLVKVDSVVKDYVLPKKHLFSKASMFRALHHINMDIEQGDNFGIVGESGCGKSTLARIIMALDKPSSGTVYYKDHDLFSIASRDLRYLRRHFQMIFQDPYSSLNPRKKILSTVSEPLDKLEKNISKHDRKERVQTILDEVGLNAGDMDKFPHEFSGGQRQRIAIARALITKPSLIVADESVSALDVSVQAQVLNLMMDLQKKFNLTFVFISHDLSVVEYITTKMIVIYLGRVVEQGNTIDIFQNPLHPYTQLLLQAIPSLGPRKKKDPAKRVISDLPGGQNSCPFMNRCYLATKKCRQEMPLLLDRGNGHKVACHVVKA